MPFTVYVLLDEQVIAIAEMPSLPIPKGNAGPSLLAYLLISKFVDHLPFYRIVQMLKRQNLTIAETTVSGWFMASCRLLWPLYQVLRTKVQQSNYIMADETTIAVLESLKKGSTHKGYHWVYYSPPTKLVCFDYQKGRAGKYPGDFLVNFKGTLQSDGYAGYDQFDHRQDIVRLSCMAHARRYFDEALKNDPVLAKYALSEIQKLYLIEQQALQSGLDPAQRHALREDKAVPVLDNFEIWLKKNLVDTLPKSAIHKAIVYALARWKQLRRYTENGLWEIDNNWVENTIRPVALGRKNYLFAGSHEAAEFAAMVYSFAASCKKNEVEPLAWFTGVLTVISEHKANRLEELLPGYVKPN